MRYVFWLIVGIAAAYGATIVADQQSVAVLSGGAGLHVAGNEIDGIVKDVIYYGSRALLAVSMFTLALALVVCSVAFGAAYKPYTAFGINPVDWLQLPQWWVMALMMAPIGFLAINLVCGIFWTNTNPVDYQMAQMNARLQNLHELVKQSADVTVAARNDVVAVAMALGFAKDNNGKLVPPGSTIHDKLLAALTVLGAQQDAGTKRWKEPEKDVLDLLRRIEGAMVPHPVPSSSETKKVA